MDIHDKIKKLEAEFAEKIADLIRLAGEKEEEEFKVGDWVHMVKTNIEHSYKDSDGRLGQVVAVYLGKLSEYQVKNINGLNIWCHKIRKATPEEIEKHLIQEAEKKGFVKGAKVKVNNGIEGSVYDANTKVWLKSDSRNEREILGFRLLNNELLIRLSIASDYIFYKQEILNLVPSHPQIEINGYKAEFKDWGLDFNNGCAKIDKQTFIDLDDLINEGVKGGNKSITSVRIGNGIFTAFEINQIVKYYNS